jgi:hypothetical protein
MALNPIGIETLKAKYATDRIAQLMTIFDSLRDAGCRGS